MEKDTQLKPRLDASKCEGCGICVDECEQDAKIKFKLSDSVIYDTDYAKCEGCGACKLICPYNAIDMIKTNRIDK